MIVNPCPDPSGPVGGLVVSSDSMTEPKSSIRISTEAYGATPESREVSGPRSDKYVSDVQVGDVIEWCGRAVTVEDYKPARTYAHGSSRYLIVSEGDRLHQLHYFDREIVAVLDAL